MQLFTPKNMSDIIIPKKEEWNTFYHLCKKKNDFNIACVGPRDTCKSSLLNAVILEFIKQYPDIPQKKLVYRFSIFDEIQLQNQPNSLSIFCQLHTNHDKLVYIDRFDEFTEQNQQWLKYYMDTFHLLKPQSKVHFLIETTQENKMKDIIKSRVNIFRTQILSHIQLYPILKRICDTQYIQLDENVQDYMKKKQNITISSLRLFVMKIILLNITFIEKDTFQKHYDYIDNTVFQQYLNMIETKNTKKANELLFELYDNGYDLSDIFYYLYEYMKDHKEYIHCIDVICYYINQHYNGNYHNIFILFLTNDLGKKI